MSRLKDIAQAADVSVTTVSLVLSNKGRISSTVRERVIAVAEEMGYFRKKEQRNQARTEGTVGLLYSFDDTWSHAHHQLAPLVVAIEETLREQGFFMSLIVIGNDMGPEDSLRRITHNNPMGLISVNLADREIFSHLEKTAVPVVLANNLEFQDVFCTVGVDDYQGTYEAARHLLNLGHRNIAYFDYPEGTFHPMANRRYYGYRAALEEAGAAPLDDDRLRVDVHDRKTLARDVSSLLNCQPKPTAFMSDDDNIMMAVWEVASELGVNVPEDISLIANGDTQDYGRADAHQLTTMRIDAAQLGTFAAEMMIKRLRNQLSEVQVVKLKEQMVDRGSCRRIDSN